MKKFSKEWFELSDLRKRLFSNAAWIPVYGYKTVSENGRYPDVGYNSETISIGAAAIFAEFREDAEKLEWTDFNRTDHSPFLSNENEYFETSSFFDWGEKKLGFSLAMSRYLNSSHPRQVEIHQDFIFAYGLINEGNIWVRPHSGYETVIKAEVNEKNEITYVAIRGEYLRDYLAARNAALRLYYYRERDSVLSEKPGFGWPEEYSIIDERHHRCEVRWHEIDETGDIPGSTWALFTAKRTDVDPDEEIPDFSDSDDESYETSSTTGVREGTEIRYRVTGALWRAEWIEPNEKTQRLGYNDPDEDFSVTIDASGEKVKLSTLRIETIGKYLWFDASLVETILSKRGGGLTWYSEQTGSLRANFDSGVHFGMNELGHINAYAYDIALLPLWERQIWVSQNIVPDGGVSEEFLKVQMECVPPSSLSAEQRLHKSIEWLDECCLKKYNQSILRHHPEIEDLKSKIHRFRALNETGLKGLAKDIVKFSIERLDKKSLMEILKSKDKNLGTLKLLQLLLATVTTKEFAEKHVAPLFGVYDLRMTDAHLSSSAIESCYDRIGIDTDLPNVIQGEFLINRIANTLGVIGTQIYKTIE